MFSVCRGFVFLGTSAVHANGAKESTHKPRTHSSTSALGLFVTQRSQRQVG